jgi:hypothetical protein
MGTSKLPLRHACSVSGVVSTLHAETISQERSSTEPKEGSGNPYFDPLIFCTAVAAA